MTAYQKYQLQWMIDHDKSLDDLMNSLTEYQVNGCEGTVAEIFDEWEFNSGFGGEIWACLDEWYDVEETDINELFQKIIDKLPNCPPAKGLENECPVWTDGTEILCRTEWIAYTIANIIDNIIGDKITHLHYYDPEEDKAEDCVDDHTGWWYVDFD